MPIDDTHKQYREHQSQWGRCRDAVGGTDRIKAQSVLYLPMLGGQNTTEYEAYKKRALFYGATRRTIGGLLGSVMRRDPEVFFPDEAYLKSCTLNGDPFTVLAQSVIREQLSVGRVGILVDAPSSSALDAKPYLTTYTTENITNWQTSIINGRRQATLVVLKELWERPVEGDAFSVSEEPQYRVLELVRGPRGLVYQQRLFREKRNKGQRLEGQWEEVKEEQQADGTKVVYPFVPSKRGVAFNYIPFVFINTTDLSTDAGEPPLLDLVDVNLSHYRNSADLEHGAHYTALPTPWVAGFEKQEELRIGSMVAWMSDNPDAKAGYLEFKGQGLNALRDLLEDKEQMMAVLGSRMLEDQKKAAEAEGTLKLRTAYESGSLVSIAKMAGDGLTQSLKIAADWMALPAEKVIVKFNTDFVAARLQPNELVALIQGLQAGAITREIFLWNLEQGEMLPPGMDVKTALQKMEMENPFGDIEDEAAPLEGDDPTPPAMVPGGGGGR